MRGRPRPELPTRSVRALAGTTRAGAHSRPGAAPAGPGAAPRAPSGSRRTRRGARRLRWDRRPARSERPPWLVAPRPRSNGDHRQPVRPGYRLARRPRVESEKRSGRDRDLLAIDPVHARSADDHIDLLLPRLGLVVLAPLAVRCDLEPVDPERLDAEHLRTKRTDPPGPAPSISSRCVIE